MGIRATPLPTLAFATEIPIIADVQPTKKPVDFHLADIVSPEKRSAMMSGIRGKDTKPEITVRRLLHRLGYRFRLHQKNLPGKPDIVLPKFRAVIFVNGCFWHGHEICHLFRLPKTRSEFWENKICANRARDARNYADLCESGWKVVIVWECAVSKKASLTDQQLGDAICTALQSAKNFIEISGQPPTSL